LTVRNIPLFSFSFCYCDTETGKWQASEKNNKSPFKQLNSRNPVKKFIDHDTGNQLARLELLFLIKTKNMQEQTNNASIFTKAPHKKQITMQLHDPIQPKASNSPSHTVLFVTYINSVNGKFQWNP
jgi:hypothetical protein